MNTAEASPRPHDGSPRLLTLLWIACALFVFYGGLIPFHFDFDRGAAWDKLAHVSLNPLISPDTGRRVSIPDVVQNILLFLPFGAFGVLSLRARRSAAASLVIVVSLAAMTSAFVETLQLFDIDRTTSLSDVCANTAGALAGAIAALALAEFARVSLLQLRARRLADVPAFYPLLIAAIVLCVAAWEPFDFTLDVGTLVGKLRALRVDVWQLGGTRDEGVELIRYVLFGLASSFWLRQLGVKSASAIAAAAGATIAFGLEGSQWILGSRMPGLEDATVHAAGAVAGSALAIHWPHGRSLGFWAGALWLMTAVAAAVQLLSPFELAAVRRPIAWLPFENYYEHTTFETLSHCFELLLMYFPAGFVTAASRSARSSATDQRRAKAFALPIAIALAVAIEAPLEYLQGWVVGRYGDVTDVALAVLGAAIGVWAGGPAWRRFLDGRQQ
ncbi:MAG TPA: VanZ family protein [Vicinamibacterales bacterium]|nr:VanZ family protein [Vicinamibacterales bacterium]